jgi:oxygen-dependent protoporphyrinogen oxidase
MARIVVVGAGISGLTLAYRLQERLPLSEVIILEQSVRAGGTIDTIARDGFVIEAGPNGFPDNNPSTLDLAKALHLEDRLIAASESASRNRFLLLDKRLRLLPNSFGSFLTSDLLSWVAKVRLLTERFVPRRASSDDESIYAFARRRVGDEIAQTFADAFVTGILAGDPKVLSVGACFPRLVNWEREHGSVMKGLRAARRQRPASLSRRAGTMWSFQGGLRTLIDALIASLRQRPLFGMTVRRVVRADRGWRVENGEQKWQADAVVLACPAYRQAELLADVDADLAGRIAGIVYNRVAVVALGFRRDDMPHSLDGFGYLSPQRSKRDVLGVQWCSSIFPDRARPGSVLLRAMCGGWHRGDMVDWSEDRLLRAVRGELAQSLGVRVAPIFQHVIRWPRAIPQYQVGHLDRLAWIDERLTRHAGLFVAGNAYRGVAINDCVEQAGIVADKVATWLATNAKEP